MPGFELIGKEEHDEVNSVFESGGVMFRHGFDAIRNNCFKVRDFESSFAKFHNCEYALAVTSGTAALRVALASLDIGNGDEVITQSFTFVATVEAIIESGATPVCAEIDETLNICPKDLLEKITPRTKAIIAVHMLGVPAQLNEIAKICKEKNIELIEDTAWGCGGRFNNRPLGTFGSIGAFSFDFAKTITCGEGGMLLFRNSEHYHKAMAWHDHGHENNPMFPRWEDTRSSSGFNYRMMELQGAIGLAQLRKLRDIVNYQRDNYNKIWSAISNIKGIYPRKIPDNSFITADALVFMVDTKELALKSRKALLKAGVGTKILPEAIKWHFAGEWSHMQELLVSHNNDLFNSFPISKNILSRSVSIPIFVNMDEHIEKKIFNALSHIFKNE